jgi:hypothetical protein
VKKGKREKKACTKKENIINSNTKKRPALEKVSSPAKEEETQVTVRYLCCSRASPNNACAD